MSILSTSSRLIKVGQEYSAGSGISIDDYIISVTGEFGKTYSAGDNINIYEQDEQLYISSKDWSDDIANASANAYNEATAQIPAPFDPSYISGKIDDKLDTTAFTAWQSGQYATDLQTVEGQINNKLDTSSFSAVSGSFLTAINIPESATWNEVSQVYEQASGTYLTSVSIPESSTWNDVSTTVQSNSAQWSENAGDEEVNSFVYDNSATINDVNTSYQTNSGDFLTAAPADMATTGDLSDLAQSISETYQVKGDYLTTADSANFYPYNNPSGFITGVDLTNYYQKNETSSKEEISAAIASIPVGDPEVNSFVESNSASLTEASNCVESNSGAWFDNVGDAEVNSFVYNNSATIVDVDTTYQANSGTYLTSHQDISNKLDTTAFSTVSGDFLTTSFGISESAKWEEATTAYEQNSGTYLTAHQDISDLMPKSESANFYPMTGNPSGFLTAHQDLSDYQTIAGMTAYQPVGNYYSASNPSGFITGVDLTPYATTAEVDTLSSFLSGAIDYVSANAGDEFPASANEAITAYQTNSGTYLTAISIPDSATWNDVSTTVQTNSATWGQGGGSVTSPSGTIIVDGSNIEATNSAVGTIVFPSASELLGSNVRINGEWESPTVFNFTLPTSGGTLYVVRNQSYYINQSFNYSGKDLNGNIVTSTMTVPYSTGTYTANLNGIVSNISAQGIDDRINDISQIYVTSPELSADGVHELAWKSDIPKLPDNMFTGYNTLITGGTTYKAAIDTDIRFSANNNTYSLTGVCSTAKKLETALNDSNTIAKSGNYYEIGNKAYKPDILGITGSTRNDTYPDRLSVMFRFDFPYTSKLDTVYLTFEATQSGTVNDSNWILYSNSGNEYTFARYLKFMERAEAEYDYRFTFDWNSWGTITNVTASATVYSACRIKELAFKDDLTGSQGGGVPQSAFDELKQSYDALSSLFATYSGQWLLPNEGV